MQRPVVVGPPGVLARDDVGIDLLPPSGGVAWNVNLRDYTNTTSGGIGNDILEVVLAVDFPRRVGVFGHHGQAFHFHGPGLIVIQMPVENIEFGERQTVNLLLDLLESEKVAACIDHDPAVWVERRIFDGDWLFDLKTTMIVRDYKLLQGSDCIKSSPDGIRGNTYGRRSRRDIDSVRLIHAMR